MSIELKIKIKNLADEAGTIRKEEAKLHGMEKWHLQHHRKTTVRNAARRTQIAYQIIRGKDWRSCTSHDQMTRSMDWGEIKRMVKKYGTPAAIESLAATEKQFILLARSGDENDGENTRSNAA